MQEFAVYSVIPPEGCAAILWRDAKRKVEAAEALKITAPDLLALGIIDEIVKEPIGGAHLDYDRRGRARRRGARRGISPKLDADGAEARLDARYEKFRGDGPVRPGVRRRRRDGRRHRRARQSR